MHALSPIICVTLLTCCIPLADLISCYACHTWGNCDRDPPVLTECNEEAVGEFHDKFAKYHEGFEPKVNETAFACIYDGFYTLEKFAGKILGCVHENEDYCKYPVASEFLYAEVDCYKCSTDSCNMNPRNVPGRSNRLELHWVLPILLVLAKFFLF